MLNSKSQFLACWVLPVWLGCFNCIAVAQQSPSDALTQQQVLQQETRSRLTESIAAAIRNQSATPVLSTSHADLKNLAAAYRIQKSVADSLLNGQSPAGFKAGLTSSDTQKIFAANQPVTGVLLPIEKHAANKKIVVAANDYRRGVIELEIGYRFRQKITAPINDNDVTQLPSLVAEIVGVVELPETGFAAKPRLGDIVATNVGVRRWLETESIKFDEKNIDINAIAVELHKGKHIVSQGNSADVLGNQWRTLQFLINKTIENGWSIEPGQLFITGALGSVVPLQKGQYHAVWNNLWQLDFVVE